MKNISVFIGVLAISIAVLAMPSQLLAVSANPNPITTSQPDGTELVVRIFGDEWYHFYESEDGYAILQMADEWWVYADLDASGRYIPSQFQVNKKTFGLETFLDRVGKHLRVDLKYRTENRDKFFNKTMPGILHKAAELGKAAGLVTMNVPVVLIQYPDFFFSQTRQSFEDMMNLANYNGTGSFRDYYKEISYNNLTVTATVVGWYTATNMRSYYAWVDAFPGDPTKYNRSRELVRRAVDQAEVNGMNFTTFDNDSDGNVDVVFVVHQGPGAECGSTGSLAFTWSLHWYLNPGPGWSNLSVTYDGKLIDRYIMQPEISCGGGHIEIGVFCHEFGHALGLPDLYDTKMTPTSEGVGYWDLMGSGNWNTPSQPAHMSAWCKKQTGWIIPTNVTANIIGQSIMPVETSPAAFRLWTDGTIGTQYFLVECRKKIGFDINLRTEGLAIWHIDESQSDNSDPTHKKVDLEEADGLNELDIIQMPISDRGDAGDLYPGSTINLNFNNSTTPNSKDYSGGDTRVRVENISVGASCSADLSVTTVAAPDLVIRDCPADVGTEPDVPCASDWVRSPDIWVDNNDDGIIDEPIKGAVNHLYIRSWNTGGTTSAVKVKCWFVNPSLGLTFPGLGTPIVDAITFESEKTIPSVGTTPLPPVGAPGYRVFFNWSIPTPPPDIDHYCMGCVAFNAADPQTSEVPLDEDNLGQINFWALVQKKGQVPLGVQTASAATTIFREKVQVNNPTDSTDTTNTFFVAAENIPPGWGVSIDNPGPFYLAKDSIKTITIDVTRDSAAHMDTAVIIFNLYTYPESALVGNLGHQYRIDDVPPAMPLNFEVRPYQLPVDNPPRPAPTVELTWFNPEIDSLGFPERVNHYKIYRSTNPQFPGNDSFLVASTGLDQDLLKPGYQYWDYVNIAESTYYYRIEPVDKAGSKGIQAISPVCTAIAGDANGDGKVNLTDIIFKVNYVFKGGPAPSPLCRGDDNGDGNVNLIDIIHEVNFVFKGGSAPIKSGVCCL